VNFTKIDALVLVSLSMIGVGVWQTLGWPIALVATGSLLLALTLYSEKGQG
jgi:hypothetical protein